MEEEDKLLKEFDALQGRINNFSTHRFSALGAGVTIITVFITLSKDAQPIYLVFFSFIVPLLVSATIRMIAAFNRGTYIFENQAAWVLKRLKLLGFSLIWPYYLKINSKDSGSHAFVIASRILNFISLFYVIFITAILLTNTEVLNTIKIISFISLACSIIIYILNEFYIKNNMCASKIVNYLLTNLDKARKEAEKEIKIL